MTHMEDIVQTALGVDEEVDIDGESTISVAIDQPLEADVGLDIELGDMGLRHRSADTSSATKKKTPRGSSVEEEANTSSRIHIAVGWNITGVSRFGLGI